MATPAQIAANRKNAEQSTGPKTPEGKARSCRNRLSHGFSSSMLFIDSDEREQFNLLMADLHNEFKPATASEQILLEKMCQNQLLSLRACRLQTLALNAPNVPGFAPPDLGLLMRYHQSSERGFYKARTELLNAQKERRKSEIGFESQETTQLEQETILTPELSVPEPSEERALECLEDHLELLMAGFDEAKTRKRIEEIKTAWEAA
jgi:hypothetical protein